jgi:hypothetical protein
MRDLASPGETDRLKQARFSHPGRRSLARLIRRALWARQDSNLGPRDYESPALPLSYRPILPMRLDAKALVSAASIGRERATAPETRRSHKSSVQVYGPKTMRPRAYYPVTCIDLR